MAPPPTLIHRSALRQHPSPKHHATRTFTNSATKLLHCSPPNLSPSLPLLAWWSMPIVSRATTRVTPKTFWDSHVNYTIWHFFKNVFHKWTRQKTYFRYAPFEGHQLCQCPYWTKGRQGLWRPSLHIRTCQNRRVSKLLVTYLNLKVA
jgi:hypothetical protein